MNYKGKQLPVEHTLRWLLLNRITFRCLKADLLVGNASRHQLRRLADYARSIDLAVSLRTDCSSIPAGLSQADLSPFLDIFLCPASPDTPGFHQWLELARQAGRRVRVQFMVPGVAEELPSDSAARMFESGVRWVNFAIADPFTKGAHQSQPRAMPVRSVTQIERIARACIDTGIEIHLTGFDSAGIANDLSQYCHTGQQLVHSCQCYQRDAYALATALFQERPHFTATVIYAMLARTTSRLSQVDNFVLRLTLFKHIHTVRILALIHRLSRFSGMLRGVPRVLDDSEPTHTYQTAMSPPAPRYLDEVDRARLNASVAQTTLRDEALRLVSSRPPDRNLSLEEFAAANAHQKSITGAARWFSVANVEKISRPLGSLEPPYTISYTAGGGHAEFIGFSFGQFARVLCPMIGLSHRVTLHVAADGQYALLLDDLPVPAAEFAGQYYRPLRIPSVAEPRIAVWNIDKTIVLQSVQIWQGAPAPQPRPPIRYSVLIVSTRYARRLQAALLGFAHQKGIDVSVFEIIVAYVPGIDAVDDVIDSVNNRHPELRVLRSPFSDQDMRWKGRMINRSLSMASGEWVVLLDSDIIVPPNLFLQLDGLPPETMFIAPAGRKMLSKDMTAAVLLGEVKPAQQWNEIVGGEGPLLRDEAGGVPIGYFQCLRRECFNRVSYEELGHFEGADWRFAESVRAAYGPELKLDGLVLLHLDHGGSHWYGTQKQY